MSNKFSSRSYDLELLDATDIPRELLFQNLRELDIINKTLGGHSITLAGMKQLITDRDKTYHIIDIGCGGGDAMIHISHWARSNNFKVKLTGVDMNKDCIAFMKNVCKDHSEIDGVVSDYRDYLKTNNSVDIVHCSLFCHHLKDDELIELFDYLKTYPKVGFVINDLQRHWFAYYSIKFLTRLFSGSVLVKNDAPLSVLRGFKKQEIRSLFEKIKMGSVSVKWKWAFRYLVIGRN